MKWLFPIILIGHNTPPITGQSEAFKLLRETLESDGYGIIVVDIGSHIENRKVGQFSFARSVEILRAIIVFLKHIISSNPKAIYLSIGISKIGFIRDFFFLWVSFFSPCSSHNSTAWWGLQRVLCFAK